MMLTRKVNNRIGRAMHAYGMLEDGDRIIIAVSGGVDSLVLTAILKHWLKKAPINYKLLGIHIDIDHKNGQPGTAAMEVANRLSAMEVEAEIVPANWRPPEDISPDSPEIKDICFTCARNRRSQIFELARQKNFNKVALGHHRDDLLETFFLNIFYAGNISTMMPRQNLFEGRLQLIRPMAFLEKDEIIATAKKLCLQPVRTPCPASGQTKRTDVRDFLEEVYERFPGSKSNVFAALSNVRQDYLLKPGSNASVRRKNKLSSNRINNE
ncbi:MAG: PP-loop domain-containing protein [Desulfobulbaceae bacterium]|nr:PP-loop domain-containing protein [Desulfobulbaceae bacterium]